jgi:hypothetical protein
MNKTTKWCIVFLCRIVLPVTDLNLVIYGLNSPYLIGGPNSVFDAEDLVRAWVQEIQIVKRKAHTLLAAGRLVKAATRK